MCEGKLKSNPDFMKRRGEKHLPVFSMEGDREQVVIRIYRGCP